MQGTINILMKNLQGTAIWMQIDVENNEYLEENRSKNYKSPYKNSGMKTNVDNNENVDKNRCMEY